MPRALALTIAALGSVVIAALATLGAIILVLTLTGGLPLCPV